MRCTECKSHENLIKVEINNKKMGMAKEFQYLGSMLWKNSTMEGDIKERTVQGKAQLVK